MANDRDAMDPYVYDLYHAVRYIEEFGGEENMQSIKTPQAIALPLYHVYHVYHVIHFVNILLLVLLLRSRPQNSNWRKAKMERAYRRHVTTSSVLPSSLNQTGKLAW